MRLRSEGAIGCGDLHVFVVQQRGHRGGTHVAEDGAFFGIRKLRDDGEAGKRADGVDGEKNLFDVRKSLQNIEVDTALFESERLFAENGQDFVWLRMAGLYSDAQRSDGAGDQYFASGGFASFAGGFLSAAVKRLHFVTRA